LDLAQELKSHANVAQPSPSRLFLLLLDCSKIIFTLNDSNEILFGEISAPNGHNLMTGSIDVTLTSSGLSVKQTAIYRFASFV